MRNLKKLEKFQRRLDSIYRKVDKWRLEYAEEFDIWPISMFVETNTIAHAISASMVKVESELAQQKRGAKR